MFALAFIIIVVAVVVWLLWLANRQHHKMWGSEPGVMKAEEDFEPKVYLGQQRD
jgi:hypothetical protein